MKLPKNFKELIRNQKPMEEYLQTLRRRYSMMNTRIKLIGNNILDESLSYNKQVFSTLKTELFFELFSPFTDVLPDTLSQNIVEGFGENRAIFGKPIWHHTVESVPYTEHKIFTERLVDDFLSLDYEQPTLIVGSAKTIDVYKYKSNTIKSINIPEPREGGIIELDLDDLLVRSPNLQYMIDEYAKDQIGEYATTRLFVRTRGSAKDLMILSNELSAHSLVYASELLALLNMDILNEKQQEYILGMNEITDVRIKSVVYHNSDIFDSEQYLAFKEKYEGILNPSIELEPEYYEVEEVRRGLKEIDTVKKKERIEFLETAKQENERILRNRRSEIEELYSKIQELREKLFFIQSQEGTDRTEEIANMLLQHPDIFAFDVNSYRLSFIVYSYLDYFEPEFAKDYFSKGGVKYLDLGIPDNYDYDVEEIYWVFEQIFVNREYRVPLYSYIDLDTLNNSVRFRSVENDLDLNTDSKSYLKSLGHVYYFNPHLEHYSCSGENEDIIQDALQVGNTEMAIAQAISTAKNMNFLDIYVTERLVYDLAQKLYKDDGNSKLLEDSEGNRVSLNEILNKRNEEKQEKQEVDSQISLMAV